MARAAFDVSRFQGVLVEAIKVGAVAWSAVAMEPWLDLVFPAFPVLVRYLLSILVVALLLEVLIAVAIGPPRVRIDWTRRGDPKPLADLAVQVSARNRVTEVFTLKVIVEPTSWLGRIAMRLLMRSEPTLTVTLDQAPLRPFVESASCDASVPAVRANDTTNGFDIALRKPPVRGGEWRWAQVRWEATAVLDGGEFNVDYQWAHERWYLKALIWLAVRKATSTSRLRMLRR